MSRTLSIAVVSDIHYASAAEQARGGDYELKLIANPLKRIFVRALRHFVWLRDPLNRNHLLSDFVESAGAPDLVIANGDYSCDTAFVGVSDDAACQSSRECLDRLRGQFSGRFHATIGDHELGKFNITGTHGGMRLDSYHRARRDLDLSPVWKTECERHVLIGVTSSLIALPVLEPETLPEERERWRALRAEHLAEACRVFSDVRPTQRILLFCHDPTALPFLIKEPAVQSRLAQLDRTIIGHLHSSLVLWQSRLLAGMPPIGFCGNTVRRLSASLHAAKSCRPFHVCLCPSLAGIELTRGGGYLTTRLDPDNLAQTRFQRHYLRR